MRNITLYLIICLGLFSCNNRYIYNSESKQILSSFSEDSTTNEIINDPLIEERIFYPKTLSQEIREELLTFCDLFVSVIQSDNIEEIKNVVDFPIWVECFKDFTYGDTITVDNFFQYKRLIFDDIFFKDMQEFKTLLKKDKIENKIDYGFDMKTSHFRISTSYQRDEEYGFESCRLFRFEKLENKYKLVLVYCAG
jgi:hypothetical protein